MKRNLLYSLVITYLALPTFSLLAISETANQSAIYTEISIGELIDKITILNIKNERIKDKNKLKNVNTEKDILLNTLHEATPITPQLTQLINELKETNLKMWILEDAIRLKEKNQQFDQEFVEIARLVYKTNDERCTIKRIINDLYGAKIIEEKGHPISKTLTIADDTFIASLDK